MPKQMQFCKFRGYQMRVFVFVQDYTDFDDLQDFIFLDLKDFGR